MQQPPAAALAAARRAHEAGRLVVLDGVPSDDGQRAALLAAADVVRADAHEAELLTGVRTDDAEQVQKAAAGVLAAGSGLVALAMESGGDLFAWCDGWSEDHLLVPPTREPVVDTTGAGDALTAGLTTALLRGDPPPVAARFAVAAAGANVGHPGGRPDLTEASFRARLVDLAAQLAPAPTQP